MAFALAGLSGFNAHCAGFEDVVAKLNSEVRSALVDPAVRQQMADQGQEISPLEQQSPEALGAHQQAEIKKMMANY